MRSALIFVSLAAVLVLGANLVSQILIIPVGGILLIIASLLLFLGYYWQQVRSINQQVKERGMTPLLWRELLRGKIIEARRPYTREARRTFIVWVSIAFVIIARPAVGILIIYLVHSFDRQQQILKIVSDVCLLIVPASFLVYALLSNNFSRESSQEF